MPTSPTLNLLTSTHHETSTQQQILHSLRKLIKELPPGTKRAFLNPNDFERFLIGVEPLHKRYYGKLMTDPSTDEDKVLNFVFRGVVFCMRPRYFGPLFAA